MPGDTENESHLYLWLQIWIAVANEQAGKIHTTEYWTSPLGAKRGWEGCTSAKR